MFKSLKNKLKSWMGKSKKEKQEEEKTIDKPPKKEDAFDIPLLGEEKTPKHKKRIFSEINKIIEKDHKIKILYENIEKHLESETVHSGSEIITDNKLLNLIKELIIYSKKDKSTDKKELREEIYYYQYQFSHPEDKSDIWDISEQVQDLFFDFLDEKISLDKILEKIEKLISETSHQEPSSDFKPKESEKEPEPLEETIEEIKQETSSDTSTEKKGFFAKLTSKLTTTTLKKEHVDEIFDDLELILLENNVALEVVDKIRSDLYKDLVGIEVKKDTIQQTIFETLKNSISEVLLEPEDITQKIKKSLEPYTIIFFGINGSGKTTSIAKLAHKLKSQGISCVLAAADTFRAAAIQQLQTHGKRLDIPVIAQDYGSDPTAVAFDAKQYAKKHKIQCILIDTAGRMYTKENLVKQMEKIIRVIKPDLKIFVGESITGNDVVSQCETFNNAVGIDGIILTKSDVDEKGGAILSVSYVTKKPIYYLGSGQDYPDLQDFKKEIVLKNIGLEE